jgi:CheY-like chemotaxis protein
MTTPDLTVSSQPVILIVDDEMDMRIFMSTLFNTSGFSALAARDGRQGLDTARSVKPALIILDVMMPGEGGALMYMALKKDPELNHIPVIMLSAVAEPAFRHYLQMLGTQSGKIFPGPQGYMEKPPDPEKLLALAHRVLGGAAGSEAH